MELAHKIGSGRYRECYAIPGTHLCLKKTKDIEWNVRSLVTHILGNPNKKELAVYDMLPLELREFFPKMYGHDDFLISERIRDFDGAYSKSLHEYGKVSNTAFWSHIKNIADMMLREKIYLFDVFHFGNNIIVQQVSENEYRPVIIDCKRLGWSAYPFQLNLMLDSEKEKKFRRRFERFCQRFQEL